MPIDDAPTNINPPITLSVEIPTDKAWALAHFLRYVPWETIESVGSGMGSERYQEALRVSDGLKLLVQGFADLGMVSEPTQYCFRTAQKKP